MEIRVFIMKFFFLTIPSIVQCYQIFTIRRAELLFAFVTTYNAAIKVAQYNWRFHLFIFPDKEVA